MKFDTQQMEKDIAALQAHRETHVRLHKSLDELAADYLTHHPMALLAETSVMDLMGWSDRQTRFPTT